MSKTWFTADTHFGHANIIRHCTRPFANVDEMDTAIIANWNAVVDPVDDIYVVGDFSFRGTKSPGAYLSKLYGRKHLVVGNHDSGKSCIDPWWQSVQQMAEIDVDNQAVVLCHYALRVWPGCHRGSIHLYGHSHGTLPGDRQSLDIGVDCWGFRPVSLTEIRRRLMTLPERGAGPG